MAAIGGAVGGRVRALTGSVPEVRAFANAPPAAHSKLTLPLHCDQLLGVRLGCWRRIHSALRSLRLRGDRKLTPGVRAQEGQPDGADGAKGGGAKGGGGGLFACCGCPGPSKAD